MEKMLSMMMSIVMAKIATVAEYQQKTSLEDTWADFVGTHKHSFSTNPRQDIFSSNKKE